VTCLLFCDLLFSWKCSACCRTRLGGISGTRSRLRGHASPSTSGGGSPRCLHRGVPAERARALATSVAQCLLACLPACLSSMLTVPQAMAQAPQTVPRYQLRCTGPSAPALLTRLFFDSSHNGAVRAGYSGTAVVLHNCCVVLEPVPPPPGTLLAARMASAPSSSSVLEADASELDNDDSVSALRRCLEVAWGKYTSK
jgi:hypothetical protein